MYFIVSGKIPPYFSGDYTKIYGTTCIQKGPHFQQLGEAKMNCEHNKNCVGLSNDLCRYESGFDICFYGLYSNSTMRRDKRSDCVFKKTERYSTCTIRRFYGDKSRILDIK